MVSPIVFHVRSPLSTRKSRAMWPGLLLLPVPWGPVSADVDQMFLGPTLGTDSGPFRAKHPPQMGQPSRLEEPSMLPASLSA